MTREEFNRLCVGDALLYTNKDIGIENDLVFVHPNHAFGHSEEYVSVTKYVVPIHYSKLTLKQ